jgi:hypothetical protein
VYSEKVRSDWGAAMSFGAVLNDALILCFWQAVGFKDRARYRAQIEAGMEDENQARIDGEAYERAFHAVGSDEWYDYSDAVLWQLLQRDGGLEVECSQFDQLFVLWTSHKETVTSVIGSWVGEVQTLPAHLTLLFLRDFASMIRGLKK